MSLVIHQMSGCKYVTNIPTLDSGNNPVPEKKINRHQKNNSIVDSVVGKILLHENGKVSAGKEANENFQTDFDGNKLYHIDNMSLEDT